jgi:hypothetical protein
MDTNIISGGLSKIKAKMSRKSAEESEKLMARQKLEAELKEGYLERYDFDLEMNKEWEGTLGDGIQ